MNSIAANTIKGVIAASFGMFTHRYVSANKLETSKRRNGWRNYGCHQPASPNMANTNGGEGLQIGAMWSLYDFAIVRQRTPVGSGTIVTIVAPKLKILRHIRTILRLVSSPLRLLPGKQHRLYAADLICKLGVMEEGGKGGSWHYVQHFTRINPACCTMPEK